MEDAMTTDQRSIVNLHDAVYGPYDMEGPVQEDMSLLLGSYDPASKRGIYVIRMEPGAETIAHTVLARVHELAIQFPPTVAG